MTCSRTHARSFAAAQRCGAVVDGWPSVLGDSSGTARALAAAAWTTTGSRTTRSLAVEQAVDGGGGGVGNNNNNNNNNNKRNEQNLFQWCVRAKRKGVPQTERHGRTDQWGTNENGRTA